jgi:hypothetical protein
VVAGARVEDSVRRQIADDLVDPTTTAISAELAKWRPGTSEAAFVYAECAVTIFQRAAPRNNLDESADDSGADLYPGVRSEGQRACTQTARRAYGDKRPRLPSSIDNKYHKCLNIYHYVDNRNYLPHREIVTTTPIKKDGKQAQVLFRVAQQIRELLDAAPKEYGAEQCGERDIDFEVQTLVFEEA